MSKEKAPAFQFYAAEYLADSNVMAMTLEEEGMYARLLAICWREVTLSANIDELASLCKGKKPTPRVVQCFIEIDGILRHKRLDEEREKQEMWRQKSAMGGRRSAHKRKNNKRKTKQQGGTTTQVAGLLQPKGNSSSSSSSSSSNLSICAKATKRAPETFQVDEDMRQWARKNTPGIDVDTQTAAFKDHEYKRSYTDWVATWRNWMREAKRRVSDGNGSQYDNLTGCGR